MIATWMIYAFAVSLLTGLAGWSFEKAARAARLPGRMVWLGSMIVSVAVPAYALLNPVKVPGVVSFSGAPAGGSASFSFPTLPTLPTIPAFDVFSPILVVVWVLSSLGLVAVFAWTLKRIATETNALPLDMVDGISVRRSRVFGPALVGVMRQQVVIPDWLNSIDPSAERLATRHESSHLAARDPELQSVGLLLAITMPWNPVMWWQFTRLRDAVELDCDARVLRAGADMKSYASLLLEIAGNRIRSPFPAVAFLSTTTQLGRRVTTMADHKKPPRYLKTALVAALGVTLTATACETPQPVGVEASTENSLLTVQQRHQLHLRELKLAGELAPLGIIIDGDSLGHVTWSDQALDVRFGPDADAGTLGRVHHEMIERDPSLVGMTKEEFRRHVIEVEEAAGVLHSAEAVVEFLSEAQGGTFRLREESRAEQP